MSLLINQTHGWIFLVLTVVAVAAVVWFYRRVPPAAARIRVPLVILRSVALALLFLALVEPVLALLRVVSERPVVAVLLDASRSMAIADGTADARRGDEAYTLLNEVVLPRVARDAELVAFSFSSELSELESDGSALSHPPSFEGDVTDLERALTGLADGLSGRNLGTVVVATDGANNRGVSPYAAALGLGVPVFVLGVGSPEAGTDIAIEDVVTNRISYAGERVPVEAIVSSSGFEGAETVVELSEDGVPLDSEQIRLSGSGEETRVRFTVTPSTPGVHRYTVSIPAAPGEISDANNTRVVATTALKGRIRVLLAASRPSWDFSFLRREFESDANVDVTAFVRKERAPSGSDEDAVPRTTAELFEYDLVVLVEPDWSDTEIPPDWLRAYVSERGGGLLTVGAPRSSPPDDAARLLPVVFGGEVSSSLTEVRVRLTGDGESAAVTRVDADRFANTDIWSGLPPVATAAAATWTARAEAAVLVEALYGGGGAAPVVASHRIGSGSVMSVLAGDIWRWKMAGPNETDAYDRLVSNAARWLTARGELARVTVESDMDVYAAGEEVRFAAQVYGADYRLERDAEVTVFVRTGESAAPVATVTLDSDGDFYRGTVQPPAPGAYVVSAVASVGGEETGTATGSFVVERFSLEDSEIRRRSALLRRVADESGGGYYTPETLDRLPSDVPLAWTERTTRREFELWNSPWLVLGFVGLMSAEWALRRKQGLP